MKSFTHKSSQTKAKLRLGDLTIGSWLTIPHQAVVEIMATAGFEWITIDMEHAAIDIADLANLIGHIQGNGMEAFVRVSKNEEVIIKRSLDAGANGIIVPMIKNKKEAIDAINYIKYPPRGKRGVGLSRAQHYGTGFESYKDWLEKECVIIFQVEHIDAVNNLEEILEIEDVDGIIVGPYDLSASMGKPGKFEEEDVQNALKKVTEVTTKMRKSLGYHVISSDHMSMLEKIKQGYNFLAYSLDFFFLGDKAREEMIKLKTSLYEN